MCILVFIEFRPLSSTICQLRLSPTTLPPTRAQVFPLSLSHFLFLVLVLFHPHCPAMQSPPPLHLSPALQIWVLLPIYLSTILIGIIRRNLSTVFHSDPPTNLLQLRSANLLTQATTFRQNASFLPSSQFNVRRLHFTASNGVLDVPRKERSSLTALMNPEALANQVLSLVLTLLPTILLGTWVRYMFAGMAVCRLPFTLTPKFRGMLQSGMELAGQNVDLSYVSAFSWYIVNMFGNSGLLSLITRREEQEAVFVPNVASQVAANVTPEKAFQQERDTLSKLTHSCMLREAEEALMDIDPTEFASS